MKNEIFFWYTNEKEISSFEIIKSIFLSLLSKNLKYINIIIAVIINIILKNFWNKIKNNKIIFTIKK